MILKNNEEKRSTLWRTVLTVSSVLIIIIAVFFVVKLFTGNPLEGSWLNEESGETLLIGDDGQLTVTPADSASEAFTADYTVDTKTKVLSVESEGGYSESVLYGTYNYSVEQDTLTLTEREYGDQLVFVRQ